jgi:CheY-like chemotaxis protein
MRQQKILLVDDSLELAENMREILMGEGHEVEVFDNPLRALDSFKVGTYWLALLDLHMPILGGVELCRLLKAQEPQLPVLVITACADDLQVRGALRAGILAVLFKPINLPKFLLRLGSQSFGLSGTRIY